MGFDLIAAPWIRARQENGSLVRLGIRQCLEEASRLRTIEHAIPIVEFGVYRLLIAIVLDALRPTSVHDVLDILEAGRFDDRVTKYLDAHTGDFDLFSSDRPFLQDPNAPGDVKPLAGLLPSWPSGTVVRHWHHAHEDDLAVGFDEAAGLLTSIAPFMTAGGAGLSPSINGSPPWYVMPVGESLFETITVNLWVQLPADVELGRPAWSGGSLAGANARRTEASLLEAYTWRPRCIRLDVSEGGQCSFSDEPRDALVRGMRFAGGEKCDFEWTDPNVAYRFGADKRTPLRPREDREPWRDVGALALLDDRRKVSNAERGAVRVRPAIVSQFAELARETESLRDGDLHLRLYGMRTDLKMKVFEWFAEDLVLPVPLILEEPLAERIVDSVVAAESVQDALRKAITRAVTLAGYAPGAEREALVQQATVSFWSAMQPEFRHLLDRVGRAGTADATGVADAIGCWHLELRRSAYRAFELAVRRMRLDGARLRAIEHGRESLTKGLFRLTTADGGAPGEKSALTNRRSA